MTLSVYKFIIMGHLRKTQQGGVAFIFQVLMPLIWVLDLVPTLTTLAGHGILVLMNLPINQHMIFTSQHQLPTKHFAMDY